MKNMIEYYYNIRIDNLYNDSDNYVFDINGKHFVFKLYNDNIDNSNDMYKLNSIVSNRLNVDSIVLNRFNSPLTKVNDNFYFLIFNKRKYDITLPLISNMALDNISISALERNNWEILWENKIDYYERQIGENEKKYPLIRESFDYFVGLAENAISYLVNTKLEVSPGINDNKVVAHKYLSGSLTEPDNLILDHRARDVAEYIKYSFYNDNKMIFKELDEYFYYNYFSIYGMRVLFSRILYPSFYFNLYDRIVSGKAMENELTTITKSVDEYETYLFKIYLYLRKYYDIPNVEWLKKQGFNPRL